MYRQNYGIGSLASTVLRNNLGPIGIFPTQYGGTAPLMSGMSTPQTTRYDRKYGLSLPMVDYLNVPLPDISGLFAPAGQPAIDPIYDPDDDETKDEILEAIAAQDDDDDSDIFNVRPGDPNIRFPNQYIPYGTSTKPGILSMVPYVGAMTKAADVVSNLIPVNPRAIKENELLGAGVALDPIGRVVQTGDYLDPTNVMAGYNAAKITDETVDERIGTINKSLNKFDKYDPFSPSYDPEATQYQLDKIKALEEFKTDILDPSTKKTKNILQSEYETDPKYQFTGPNVQGDFKTTNNIVDEVALTGDADGPSGLSDTADDFDDGTMTGKTATSTGKTAIDSFFDAVDKTATKGGDSGGKSSDVGGTGSAAAADTSQGETGYGSCFIAGTKVTMADGTTKNIEDIKVGDIVKGHKGNNEVIKLDPTLLGKRKLYSFNDNEHYFFTSEHPFMTEEGWKSIKPEKTKERDGIELYNQLEGELKIGNKLVTEKGLIEIKEIKSKEINDPKMPLYNFNVSNDNSYIADGYVVHNKGGGGGGKIVCTMMNESYGFGSFRNKIWLKHSKSLAPEYQKGYHKIFLPLVKYAKQDGVTNKIVKNILEHIAVHRTIDIRQESRGKIHLLGRIYRKVLEPICYLVGKHG